jgi:hypothetical protein
MLKQAITVCGIVLAVATTASAASESHYRLVRDLPQGGGRAVPQLVPTDHGRAGGETPYALTGRNVDQPARQWKFRPLHPRGGQN